MKKREGIIVRIYSISWLLRLDLRFLVLASYISFVSCATRLDAPKPDRAEVELERQAQLKLALDTYLDRQARILRISFSLFAASEKLCGDDVETKFPIFLFDPAFLPKELRDSAKGLGYSKDTFYYWNHYGTVMESDGTVAKGDRLLEVEGRHIAKAKNLGHALEAARSRGELLLKFKAAHGDTTTIELQGVQACQYSAQLLYLDAVNAFADGRRIFVTTGMLRLGLSDAELAIILGHEIGHNALGHIRQRKSAVGIGAILGAVLDIYAATQGVDTYGSGTQLGAGLGALTQQSFSQDFEAEADYFGMYLAARAGFDISVAPEFWRRMAVESPASVKYSMMASHPSTPERSVALQEAIREIQLKRETQRPLVPERISHAKLPGNIVGEITKVAGKYGAVTVTSDLPIQKGNILEVYDSDITFNPKLPKLCTVKVLAISEKGIAIEMLDPKSNDSLKKGQLVLEPKEKTKH